MTVQGIGIPGQLQIDPLRAAQPAAGGAGGAFGDVLKGILEQANTSQGDSDRMVESLARGEPTDVHDVMIAMTEADLSFRMLLEVRNRLIDAYQEIQRMPL